MVLIVYTTQDGCTPLVTAAFDDNWDVVIELLDNRADVSAQNNVSPFNTVIVYKKFICRLITFRIY